MNLITSFVLLLSLIATVQCTTYKITYKANSLIVYSEAFWQDQGCIQGNLLSVFVGNGFSKQTILLPQFQYFSAVEVYGTVYSNCNATYAKVTEFYSSSENPKLSINGLRNSDVSVSATAQVYSAECGVDKYFEPFFNETFFFYNCSYGEGDPTEVPFTMDLSTQTSGFPYLESSRGVRKGRGFITRYQSRSQCKNQQAATFSNLVVGNVPITVNTNDVNGFSYGDICKVKEGSSDRYFFIPL